MANFVKYTDETIEVNENSEIIAANGYATGEQIGTPTQGYGEVDANADAHWVAHETLRYGTRCRDISEISLSYDLNGGVGEIVPTQTVASGVATTTAEEPTITIYPEGKDSFDSWNTKADGSGTEYDAEDDITITEDTILYAQYADEA